jgi:hypothetical protein
MELAQDCAGLVFVMLEFWVLLPKSWLTVISKMNFGETGRWNWLRTVYLVSVVFKLQFSYQNIN